MCKTPPKVPTEAFDTKPLLTGKSREQIVRAVGTPNSVSDLGGGKILCQWIEPGYHITLTFDHNKFCEGLDHKAVV